MKAVLKVALYVVGGLAAIVLIVLGWASMRWNAPSGRPVVPMTASTDPAVIARGEFLYTRGHECWQCHGDRKEHTAPPKGGMVFDLTTGPFNLGVFYARNITPDKETGIGTWTDGEIVRALREGLSKDGSPLFPIMPTVPLHGLSDDDALAIAAYLRTLPAVKNEVSNDRVALFTKVLFTLGAIGPLEAITKPIATPDKSIPALYGRYLATNASGCFDCHTPRNLNDGSFYTDSLFAGSSFGFGEPEGDPSIAFAANITPDMATGIGSWSEETFLHFMRTGAGPEGVVRDGHMPYATFSAWPEEDLKAVFAYLRTLRPIERPKPPKRWAKDGLSQEPLKLGGAIYETYCLHCHGRTGEGGLAAQGNLSDALKGYDHAALTRTLNAGAPDMGMPGFDKTLNDEQMKALAAYLRTLGK